MYNVSNNAATKLVGVLGVSDTELTVQDGSLFPAPPFLITLYKPRTRDDVVEIIRVNTKDGNVFSDLERGYEGTTARAWDDTVEHTYVENRFTAGTYQKLKEILEGLESHASSHAIGGADRITPASIGAVAAVSGKGLSTNDFTTAEKNKLAGIADNANNYTHPSTHPASMITGLHSSATTGVAGSVAWGNVTGKPSTFAPSSHSHGAGDLPSATTSAKGVVQLSTSTSSTSTTLAATASAVKAAYDKGNHSHPYAPSSHTHSKSDVGLDSNEVAIGSGATASGYQSTALGGTSKASGIGAAALGHSSTASGNYSTALGHRSTASRDYSTALGRTSEASGIGAAALGHSSTASADYSTALGYGSSAAAANEVSLGNTSAHVKVPGKFTVQGTKNFEIPHPNPDKKSTHMLRHGAVESPTAGDTLYRYKVQSENNNEIVKIELPDYFIHLNKNVQIFVTPQGHFGQAYGSLNREDETLEITCQYAGEYNVLVIGTRNDDHESVQTWDIKGVEREVGESWLGETLAFEVNEIMEVEEIKEVN